jgi:hypothetical protein
MTYRSVEEVERLVARFCDCSLPCAEWTHVAHLTVGLWHARTLGADEALAQVRAGIRRYNVACGTENTTTRGYHETLTRFYMTLIGQFLAASEEQGDLLAVTNALIAELGHRELPLAYYTRERLMSAEARAHWVEPDLRPLE